MQTIYIDISNKSILPTIYAKQGDIGRKFKAVVLENSVSREITVNDHFSAGYDGASGSGNYETIGERSAFEVYGNVVTVELAPNMLQAPGLSNFCLTMNSEDGNVIGLWNIVVDVEETPGFLGDPIKDYYPGISAVLYVDQNLSEKQKEKARANIGSGTGNVKTVNGIAPDEDGNVKISVGGGTGGNSGGNVDQVSVEPMDGDLPKVFLTGEAFSDMTAEKNEVLMDMEYISKTDRFKGAIKIKWQGSSSVSTPSFLRKNFTVKLYVDDTYESKLKKAFKDWGVKENKWVLKSNWIDITASRNIVSARLWNQIVSTRADYNSLPEEIRTSPRNCEVDGFPIKLYANGVYEGIYTWNIPKDGFMFNMDEDNPNHAVLCAEKNNDVGTLSGDAISACEFRKTAKVDGSDWSLEFPDDLQNGIKTSFNNLINFVMTASDADFTANLDNYLDVQSAIDYYIFAYLNCGADSLGKNLIMMTYDGVKWYASQYDMDSTWGLHFAASKFYDPAMKCPEEYQENNSLLWQRIVNCFAQRLQDRYFELRNTVLSETNIINEFERFIDGIPYEIRKEEQELEAYISRPLKFTNNIQQIRSFVVARAKYVDGEFRAIVPILPTRITLDNSTLLVALDGTAKLTATIEPEDATSKSVVWTSSDNSVATVDDGVVSGISRGSAVITATTTNGLSASCAITVEVIEIPVTGLAFANSEVTVNWEETPQYQLGVVYTPSNTTQTDVVWASDNEAVATVDQNGLVTFKAKGNVNITATSVDNSTAVASCAFTVMGSNMIDYYFCGADGMSAGANNVSTYSAYEASGFANNIVEFPTKNTDKATIECDVLEVVAESEKRAAEKSLIAGICVNSSNTLSIKLPVADVPPANPTALYQYLHENPIHCKFKACDGVKEFDIPTNGWERTIQSEVGRVYYFTLAIDSNIAGAIEASTSKRTSIGEFKTRNNQAQNEYRHEITLSGGVLTLKIPKTGTEQTVEDAMAYLNKFGTVKIYYV
jgi:uncharacterized protein YjdB